MRISNSGHYGEVVQTKCSLTEGSIPRALLAFALPILFGNVLQSVNGSVDAVWVGKYPGEAAFYYCFGGWREIRMGVADASAGRVPTA
jgi:Na+-driven multidrug efflux pump